MTDGGRSLLADDLFASALSDRLRALGVTATRILLHSNRTVMLSLSRGVLRVHRGYAYAPDRVLQAIARFLDPRAPRAVRRAAEREFLAFPVDAHVAMAPPRRRVELERPGDAKVLERLKAHHAQLNREHFGGVLQPIRIRLSAQMRTRLGELVLERRTGRAVEIRIGRRHLRRDGWTEVAHTLLHEMVHQWQAETGRPVDHGAEFRRKAQEVGIVPRARRMVG